MVNNYSNLKISIMKKAGIIILSMMVILSACDRNEKVRLTAKVDSLQHELSTQLLATQTLQEVGVLIDSIDASRKLLRTSMVEGTTYEDYVSRMDDIHSYVKQTERKIDELNASLKSSKALSASYEKTIKKLKGELNQASQELVALKEMVATIRTENQNLANEVSVKQTELAEKSEMIQLKEQALASLEVKVQEIAAQAKYDQAEAYYRQALAVEETANRTKFAPKKKKETRREALELFKMALLLGKSEAQPKIAQLESDL
jgi:chromosome segregation ATPase